MQRNGKNLLLRQHGPAVVLHGQMFYWIACACLLWCAPGANAESPDRYKPLLLSADDGGGTGKNTGTLKGHVVFSQGSMRIEAQWLHYDYDNNGEMIVHATGDPIHFHEDEEDGSGTVEGYGQKLDYDSKSDIAHLTGRANFKHGGDEVRGESIVYNLKTKEYAVDGVAPAAQSKGKTNQVTVFIESRKKPPASSAAASAAHGKQP